MATDESRQTLARFCDLVLADRQLHLQLCAMVDVETFAALATRLGRDHGCEFSVEDVQTAIRERRRAWLERHL